MQKKLESTRQELFKETSKGERKKERRGLELFKYTSKGERKKERRDSFQKRSRVLGFWEPQHLDTMCWGSQNPHEGPG